MSVESELKRIADSLEALVAGESVPGLTDTGVGTVGEPEITHETATAVRYDELVLAKNRDELLRLCGEKTIPVPPRTSTAKLAELLKASDALAAGDTGAGSAEDPFAEEEPDLDHATVMAALKAVHTKDGVERVVEILQAQGGGVQKMSALKPEFYKAVYDEASK